MTANPPALFSSPSSCVEYLRLVTNRGRVLELGNAASGTQLITSYPNKPTGFLAAVRCARARRGGWGKERAAAAGPATAGGAAGRMAG